MNAVIQVQGLTHRFGPVLAIDQMTYSVEEGEVFGVLGPNGAGKTTSVRLLNGLLSPAEGTIRVFAMDPVSQGAAIRRRTGVLTETPSLYERLNARENLEIFGALYDVPEQNLPARINQLLDLFQLADRSSEKVGGYSKGMKQRLALARALLHEPELLFLDEPTSGLDPQAAKDVSELIQELSRQQGRTIFLATHNLDEAQRLCSRVAVLNHGRILAVGSLAELERTLWRSLWVDIQLESAVGEDVLLNLRDRLALSNFEADGAHLAVEVDHSGLVPDLVAALVERGARILRVQPRQHNLEEIYFAVQNQSAVFAGQGEPQ